MNIACLVFDQITLLDAVGPMEVLSRIPGASVRIVAPENKPLRSNKSGFRLIPDCVLEELTSADIVLVPGGPGVRPLLEDKRLLDWVRGVHRTTEWTTSVCTGSLLLAAAGLLEGLPATTHWNALSDLERYGAKPVKQRVVVDGKIVMGAGVSAGIDMALTLASLVAGEAVARAIQLRIEYDPKPPFDAGSPDRVDEIVLDLARGGLDKVSAV
ncbi:MAG: DJ-1/PfpI family protein [Gammaproteobacteria bacterium]|nr:DJ-1/PfpI family protein [Gammaproteobacteria bacterium]MDH3411927.1 DJ-1/PfpI family protein [Gammaproteobacteria bacterium]